jgi:serine/threonine-protein kinase
MPLEPGTTLGPYSVTAKIGEGGMGEVYRARDTKLDRDVALKVLPEAFTSDPDRLARFEREAKVLASLNHTNIGGIYGLEESDGVRALVLEYVEGPTLADRIAQGPIPIDEALPIAKQIAEALEVAHEQGIIHRDLKPANIKVKDDGTVKVLDFGLAKAFTPETPDVSGSMSPTISLTAAATQMGMVIGTAAYMAPEQAKGLPVDKRADVWAFGAVLFEMLTGKKLFDAGDVSEMLASVLVKDPDISSMGTHVPANIRSVVRRCLVKDPRNRLRDIGDMRLAMEGAFETMVSAPPAESTAPHPSAWRLTLPWVAAVLLAVITGIAVWSLMRAPAPRLERFAIPLPAPETMGISQGRRDIAVSPDGSTVVFSSADNPVFQLYVRPLDALTATPLQGLDRALEPFVSADSEWVGFFDNSDDTLRRVSIFGGPPVTICRIDDLTLGADWAEDDTIVFGTDAPSGLWRVSANGGEPEELTTPDVEQGVNHGWPHVLPGGRALLFTILSGAIDDAQIALLDLETGDQRVLVPGGSAPSYSPTGHIVYGVGNTLRAVGFDLDRLEVTNPNPVPVLDGVITKNSGAANFDLARDGSLVYVAGTGGGVAQRTLVWVDRAGREEPLETPVLAYQRPRVSPDGTRVAVDVADPEGADIWIHNLVRGTERRLTTDPAVDIGPLWTPDGDRVVFESDREGPVALFSKLVDAPGDAERLMSASDRQTIEAAAWAADGQTLLFWWAGGGVFPDIGLLSMEGERASEMLLETEFQTAGPAISPDGGWLAYHSDETGSREVYVQRFPDLGDKELVSTDGGEQPLWSPDGQELFYRGPRGMMVVPVETDPTFRAGDPEVLFDQQYYFDRSRRTYDLAPDGQRFLMVKEGAATDDAEGPAAQAILIQNWFEELTRLVPTP